MTPPAPLSTDKIADAPLAIYIHWPYCARICPYCDFNIHKNCRDDGLLAAIKTDLAHWRTMSGPRPVGSVHFGGGTPSLMTPAQIQLLLQTIDQLWGIHAPCEIGLEANPKDGVKTTFEAFHKAGINRLSLGVQTFNDDGLKGLGRDHDASQSRHSLEQALKIFPSVSLDLIFGWKDQTPDMWQADLDMAQNYMPHHMSTYQLTIEDGTAFGRAAMRGDLRAVNDDQSADLYQQAQDHLNRSGYDHYEISNFARPGHQSQHNLAYWRAYDYVGVGPGAHGRLCQNGQKLATIAQARPDDYKALIAQTGSGIAETEILTPQDQGAEFVLMGLRIREGISLTRYHAITGQSLNINAIQTLKQQGLLTQSGDMITATAKGRAVLNRITEMLLL